MGEEKFGVLSSVFRELARGRDYATKLFLFLGLSAIAVGLIKTERVWMASGFSGVFLSLGANRWKDRPGDIGFPEDIDGLSAEEKRQFFRRQGRRRFWRRLRPSLLWFALAVTCALLV
jgi:hypothetical protein